MPGSRISPRDDRWLRRGLLLICAITAGVALVGQPAQADDPKHSARYLLAKKLNQGLKGTPLEGLGFAFEAAGHRHGISPFFLIGASGTESSLGAAGCSGNPRNIWGIGACNRAWTVPYFPDWKSAVGYYARFIKRTWPKARTVYELHGYCPPCGSYGWGSKTLAWMQQLFGPVSSSIFYPGRRDT